MRDITGGMLQDVLSAFKTLDADLAVEICQRDDQIDRMYSHVFNEFIGLMASRQPGDRNGVYIVTGQMWVARHLGRVADHVTNIAERVYFVAKGEILARKSETRADREELI
jgi:phosphate transport system protein